MKQIEFAHEGKTYRVGRLLTHASVKTRKGEKRGYYTSVLYLNTAIAPKPICPSHTDDCLAGCLKSSGNLGLQDGHKAITTRAIYWLHFRDLFLERLRAEITAAVARADRLGMVPCFRLNGSSDIAWESPKHGAIIPWILETFPHAKVYDYTKIVGRARTEYLARFPGYHVTFSWSGENERQCVHLLRHGISVAVPFDIVRGKDLPGTFLDTEVIDGDLDDLRFLDPRGVIVGLRYKLSFDRPEKGRKIVKPMGFIVSQNDRRIAA